METPTITKKQAKSTLSGKKKKAEVIKNALVQPYQQYWPLLSIEDNQHLHKTLEKLLPRLKPLKPIIPYAKIKNIPREERKNFRKTFYKENDLEVSENDKNNLIFGVNAVTKLLEAQEAGAILVANEVKPRFLVDHIINQAVLYNIPVLVVDDLKAICEKKSGIKGVVLAIRKSCQESDLGALQQIIADIHSKYPFPQNHINSKRKLEISAISIPDSDQDDSVLFLNECNEEINLNTYLLKRINGRRAFIPEKSTEKVVFIDLDCSEIEATSSAEKSEANENYQNLKVKRYKGNKNRNKRKLERLKKNE